MRTTSKRELVRRPSIETLETRTFLTCDIGLGIGCDPGVDFHGDKFANATSISEVEREGPMQIVVGTIQDETDVDMFRFKATSEQTQFMLSSMADTPSDGTVSFFDESGNPIDGFEIGGVSAITSDRESGESPVRRSEFAFTGKFVVASHPTEVGKTYYMRVTWPEPQTYFVLVSEQNDAPRLDFDPDDHPQFGTDIHGGGQLGGQSELSFDVVDDNVRHQFLQAYIDSAADTDDFAFVADGNELRVDVASEYTTPLTVELRDAAGEVVLRTTSSNAGQQLISERTDQLVVGELYEVSVTADEPTSYELQLRLRDSSNVLVPGDFNQDGLVDFTDFLVVSANFGTDVDQAFIDGDMDGDSMVDFGDFLIFAGKFRA